MIGNLKILMVCGAIVVVAGCQVPSTSTSQPPAAESSASATPESTADKITQENYDKIETGMTLDQIVEILGEGKEMSSSSMDFAGQTIETSVYIWQTDGFPVKNITITLQNGKVTSKAQFGL